MIWVFQELRKQFGDMANTMNSPSNQLRMLQQNFANLARTIGNLFLPIVEKVLPYINGLVMALQRLFAWIGSLLGIEFKSINSSMGGADNGMENFVSDTEDAGDALKETPMLHLRQQTSKDYEKERMKEILEAILKGMEEK